MSIVSGESPGPRAEIGSSTISAPAARAAMRKRLRASSYWPEKKSSIAQRSSQGGDGEGALGV